MNLGWKTITGAILLGLAQIMSAAITDCPVPEWVPWLKWLSSLFNASGMVLAGIGVSSKVATAVNSVTSVMEENQRSLTKGLSAQRFVEKVIEKRIPYIVKRLGPGDELMVRQQPQVKEAEKEP
jgi:hypothetical protein